MQWPTSQHPREDPGRSGAGRRWGDGGDCIGPLLSTQEEEKHRKIE